jgi:hypothetical protein
MNRKGIIENRFLLKNESYIIDLNDVEFLTWNKNKDEKDSYWVKLHVGTKETRYVCRNRTELSDIINAWAMTKNVEIEIDREEIGEQYEF